MCEMRLALTTDHCPLVLIHLVVHPERENVPCRVAHGHAPAEEREDKERKKERKEERKRESKKESKKANSSQRLAHANVDMHLYCILYYVQ